MRLLGSRFSMPPAEALRRGWEDLPLTIKHKMVTHMVRPNRTTAIVHLEGGGEHGYGEEVTFQEDDLLPASPHMPWRFTGSFREFSLWLALHELFERAPEFEVVRNFGSGRSRLQPSISRSARPASVSTRSLNALGRPSTSSSPPLQGSARSRRTRG
jgi:hypothetical protein